MISSGRRGMFGRAVRAGMAWAVGLALLATGIGCDRSGDQTLPAPAKSLKKLVVVTPHGDTIRSAFATGFSSWYLKKHGDSVHIEWVCRGTPRCVDYVRAAPAMASEGAPYHAADVFFGGGTADHGELAAEGFCRPVKIELPANYPTEVSGLPTRDEEGRWLATGLSSFGLVYNDRACIQRGVRQPMTWTDLADPRFQGWIGVADPMASGSNRECLVLILAGKGWDRGWGTIMKILANARALDERSGNVLSAVKTGACLAGFSVNFEGMALAVETRGAVKYVDPPGGTAATPDIISVLSTSKAPAVAEEFVRYVLSDEGQALWGVPSEYRTPHVSTLYHYPIMPDTYERWGDKLAVRNNPLEEGLGLEIAADRAARLGWAVRLFVRAACQDHHVALQETWKAVIDAGLPEEAVAMLTAPPCDEATGLALGEKLEQAQPEEAEALLAEWSAKFAERYAEVRALLGG